MSSCVFCDFSSIQSNVVATIRGFNVTATLGQITNGGYLLLIPESHVPCLGDLESQSLISFIELLAESQSAILKEYGNGVTIFEHGVVGQTIPHAHLHLLPVNIDMTLRVQKDFSSSEMDVFPDFEAFHSFYTLNKRKYLLWSSVDGSIVVCWEPQSVPMYLRLVASEMLGVPERGNWRNVPAEEDKNLRDETLRRMQKYF